MAESSKKPLDSQFSPVQTRGTGQIDLPGYFVRPEAWPASSVVLRRLIKAWGNSAYFRSPRRSARDKFIAPWTIALVFRLAASPGKAPVTRKISE